MNKKILFCYPYNNGYNGAAILIREFASYLKSSGNYTIHVVGNYNNKGIKNFYAEKEVFLFDIDTLDYEIIYDAIISISFLTIPLVLQKGLKYKKIIHYCLGMIEEEALPFFYDQLDLIITITEEIKTERLLKYPNIQENKIQIIPNTIPFEYFNIKKTFSSNLTLKKIAMVSNHVPKEMREAANLIRKKGIQFDFYGIEDTYILIKPEVLLEYDAIISIGKTVYYALAQGIPAFCYDHFGGFGYINKENFDEALFANFSGRHGGVPMSANQLHDRILEDFKTITTAELSQLRSKAERLFKIDIVYDRLLSLIEECPSKKIELNHYRLYQEYYSVLMQRDLQIQAIYASTSWKFSNSIVSFLTKLKKLLFSRKG